MELSGYKRCFSSSYDQFIVGNNVEANHIAQHVKYEKLVDVTRVDVSESEFFFFKEGALQIIYISNGIVASKLWRECKDLFDVDEPEKRVRSRAGKTSNQLIFAHQGVTVSMSQSDIDFIEIYPSCSLQEYLDGVYREPGLFIR